MDLFCCIQYSEEELQFKGLRENSNAVLKKLQQCVRYLSYHEELEVLLRRKEQADWKIRDFFKPYLSEAVMRVLYDTPETKSLRDQLNKQVQGNIKLEKIIGNLQSKLALHINGDLELEVKNIRAHFDKLAQEKNDLEKQFKELTTKGNTHCDYLERKIDTFKQDTNTSKEKHDKLEQIVKLQNGQIEELNQRLRDCQSQNVFLIELNKNNEKAWLDKSFAELFPLDGVHQHNYVQLQNRCYELEEELKKKNAKQSDTQNELENALNKCSKLTLRLKKHSIIPNENSEVWATPCQSFSELQSTYRNLKPAVVNLENKLVKDDNNLNTNTLEKLRGSLKYMQTEDDLIAEKREESRINEMNRKLQKELHEKNCEIEEISVRHSEYIANLKNQYHNACLKLQQELAYEKQNNSETVKMKDHIICTLQERLALNNELPEQTNCQHSKFEEAQSEYNQLREVQNNLDSTTSEHNQLLKQCQELQERCEYLENNNKGYMLRINELEKLPQNSTDLEKRSQNYEELENSYIRLQKNYKALENEKDAQLNTNLNLKDRVRACQEEMVFLQQLNKAYQDKLQQKSEVDLQSVRPVTLPLVTLKKTDQKVIDQHQSDSLVRIEKVNSDVADIAEGILKYEVTNSEQDYFHLRELLIRSMIDLDNIESHGDHVVRTRRSKSVQRAQELINLLESKHS